MTLERNYKRLYLLTASPCCWHGWVICRSRMHQRLGGVLIGVLMLAINWYYKHQSFRLLRDGKISRGEYESFNR